MKIDATAVSQKRTIILLANRFDACLAVASIKQLRESGIAVLIVGQTADLVRDINGIKLRTDKSLSDLAPLSEDKLLILPGDKAFVASLLTDPRVHNLIKSITNENGYVLVSDTVRPLFERWAGKRPLSPAWLMNFAYNDTQAIAPELIDFLVC